MVMNGQSLYEGQFLDGMRDGWGRLFFHTGGYYEGQFKENCFSGKGSLYVAKQDASQKRPLRSQKSIKLKQQDYDRQLQELVLKQKQQLEDCEQAHTKDSQEFDQKWNEERQKIQFDNSQALKELENRHVLETEKNRNELEAKLPITFESRLKKRQLIIRNATYGDADITEKLIKMYKQGQRIFYPKNESWGDPQPGKTKWLKISYNVDGKEYKESAKENTSQSNKLPDCILIEEKELTKIAIRDISPGKVTTTTIDKSPIRDISPVDGKEQKDTITKIPIRDISPFQVSKTIIDKSPVEEKANSGLKGILKEGILQMFEVKEQEVHMKNRQKKIIAAEAQLILKQQKEMNTLKMKHESILNEREIQRQKQHNQLLLSYQNKKTKIENQHKKEVLQLQKVSKVALRGRQQEEETSVKEQVEEKQNDLEPLSVQKGEWLLSCLVDTSKDLNRRLIIAKVNDEPPTGFIPLWPGKRNEDLVFQQSVAEVNEYWEKWTKINKDRHVEKVYKHVNDEPPAGFVPLWPDRRNGDLDYEQRIEEVFDYQEKWNKINNSERVKILDRITKLIQNMYDDSQPLDEHGKWLLSSLTHPWKKENNGRIMGLEQGLDYEQAIEQVIGYWKKWTKINKDRHDENFSKRFNRIYDSQVLDDNGKWFLSGLTNPKEKELDGRIVGMDDIFNKQVMSKFIQRRILERQREKIVNRYDEKYTMDQLIECVSRQVKSLTPEIIASGKEQEVKDQVLLETFDEFGRIRNSKKLDFDEIKKLLRITGFLNDEIPESLLDLYDSGSQIDVRDSYLYKLGMKQLDVHNYAGAIKHFQNAINQAINTGAVNQPVLFSELYRRLAEAYLKSGQPTLAIAQCKIALRINPKSHEALVNEDAETYLNKIIHGIQVDAYISIGDLQEASVIWKEFANDNEDQGRLLNELLQLEDETNATDDEGELLLNDSERDKKLNKLIQHCSSSKSHFLLKNKCLTNMMQPYVAEYFSTGFLEKDQFKNDSQVQLIHYQNLVAVGKKEVADQFHKETKSHKGKWDTEEAFEEVQWKLSIDESFEHYENDRVSYSAKVKKSLSNVLELSSENIQIERFSPGSIQIDATIKYQASKKSERLSELLKGANFDQQLSAIFNTEVTTIEANPKEVEKEEEDIDSWLEEFQKTVNEANEKKRQAEDLAKQATKNPNLITGAIQKFFESKVPRPEFAKHNSEVMTEIAKMEPKKEKKLEYVEEAIEYDVLNKEAYIERQKVVEKEEDPDHGQLLYDSTVIITLDKTDQEQDQVETGVINTFDTKLKEKIEKAEKQLKEDQQIPQEQREKVETVIQQAKAYDFATLFKKAYLMELQQDSESQSELITASNVESEDSEEFLDPKKRVTELLQKKYERYQNWKIEGNDQSIQMIADPQVGAMLMWFEKINSPPKRGTASIVIYWDADHWIQYPDGAPEWKDKLSKEQLQSLKGKIFILTCGHNVWASIGTGKKKHYGYPVNLQLCLGKKADKNMYEEVHKQLKESAKGKGTVRQIINESFVLDLKFEEGKQQENILIPEKFINDTNTNPKNKVADPKSGSDLAIIKIPDDKVDAVIEFVKSKRNEQKFDDEARQKFAGLAEGKNKEFTHLTTGNNWKKTLESRQNQILQLWPQKVFEFLLNENVWLNYSKEENLDLLLSVCGYPSSTDAAKKAGFPLKEMCYHAFRTQKQFLRKITKARDKNLINYPNHAWPGNSGSPIIFGNNGLSMVIGVHTGTNKGKSSYGTAFMDDEGLAKIFGEETFYQFMNKINGYEFDKIIPSEQLTEVLKAAIKPSKTIQFVEDKASKSITEEPKITQSKASKSPAQTTNTRFTADTRHEARLQDYLLESSLQTMRNVRSINEFPYYGRHSPQNGIVVHYNEPYYYYDEQTNRVYSSSRQRSMYYTPNVPRTSYVPYDSPYKAATYRKSEYKDVLPDVQGRLTKRQTTPLRRDRKSDLSPTLNKTPTKASHTDAYEEKWTQSPYYSRHLKT